MSAAWWQLDLDAHRQVNGRCPRCRTRKRCWPWATANAARVVAGMTSS
ncbi:hypothetical protein AB0C02_28255 [Micromonospora sp. NPDC048999]